MSPDQSTQLLAQLLWKAVVICAPLLLTLLAVGVLISILQVVTQIQEMTLTFIPKLIAAVLVLAVAGPWMLAQLLAFSIELFNGIPRYV